MHSLFFLKILSNLKSKLESVSQTYNDFNSLVDLAHETLYERENPSKVHSLEVQDGKSIEQSQGKSNSSVRYSSSTFFFLVQTKNESFSRLGNLLQKVFIFA